MADERPTDADVTEALSILKDYAKIRREGSSEEVRLIKKDKDTEKHAKDVLRRAGDLGTKPTIPPKKNKNDPKKLIRKEIQENLITKNQKLIDELKAKHNLHPDSEMVKGGMYGGGEYKKPQMVHGGVHKGKKHAYAAGGMVKDMKIMRNK